MSEILPTVFLMLGVMSVARFGVYIERENFGRAALFALTGAVLLGLFAGMIRAGGAG